MPNEPRPILNSTLPSGDRTPPEFQLPTSSYTEKLFKKPIRRYLYPFHNFIIHQWLSRKYGKSARFPVDKWLWGQRGNDYESHRRRVNRLVPLRGKSILIAGCGTGRDIPSWLNYKPESLAGIDLFCYEKAWSMLKEDIQIRFPGIRASFIQADISRLDGFADSSFDVIGSDAFFEHVNQLPSTLKEFHRLLKPGGVIYATFGPLWYCWGGDHISGYDSLSHGYNHLLLKAEDYESYLNGTGQFKHSEHDGRTWVKNDLFSYLTPSEYISLLSERFIRNYTAAIIEPRAVRYLALHKMQRTHLVQLVSDPLDLVITGMTIVYRKARE